MQRRIAFILSVLMMFTLCGCGLSLPKVEETEDLEIPEFGEYTGLTIFLPENDIARITYRPGTMGDVQELYVTDADEIGEIVDALKKVSISGITYSTVTDWYPSITLESKSEAELCLSFDGEWLAGRNVNYELSGMDSVWKLIRKNAKEPDPLISGDFIYEIIDGENAEIKEYTGEGGTVTIPEKIEGFTVTSIGYGAFQYCEEVTELILPPTISEIGRGAFAYCDGLTSFKAVCGNLKIESCAFEYCDSLGEIEISGEDVTICKDAFHYCKALHAVDIKGTNITIGSDAFEYCTGLKEASVSGTESADIADDAFSYCGENFQITG